MVDLPSRPAPPLPSPIIETAPEPVAIFEPAPAPKPVLADKPKPKPIPVKKPLAVPAPVIEVAPSPTAVIAPPAPIIEKYIPPSSDADYLRNPPPAYPLAARKRGIEGVVRLNVEVSADGAALAVNIAVSSGFAPLDEAALAAVRNWRFEPAKRGGKAVSARVEIPLRFKLSN
jgi:protein TonB